MTTSTFASRILALCSVVRRRSFPTQAKEGWNGWKRSQVSKTRPGAPGVHLSSRPIHLSSRPQRTSVIPTEVRSLLRTNAVEGPAFSVLSFASALLLVVFMLAAASAHATTYTVTDLTDSATDTGSIRYAVNQVNAGTGGDTIDFSGAGASGTITLTNGTLLIKQSVTITGPGANLLTISGNKLYEVFLINSGVTASISGLTIANGSSSNGGGIANYATLTVSNSTFSGNSASGGGIFNDSGTLTVSNSTFSGNTTNGGYGGGIYNKGGTSTVSNSTFSGNTAGLGGGILNNGGTLKVSNSTFSGNTAQSGGGIANSSGNGAVTTLTNSIVAGNTDTASGQTGNDCYQCGTQSSNNLISTSSSSPSPNLGPLQYNGGPTETMMPLTGSPALNAGLSSTFSTDQRGFPRPTGSGAVSDLGAVQLGPLTVTTTADSTDSSAVCDGSDVCSLRDAITLANSQGSGDISFASSITSTPSTITLTSALPPITATNINITGPGANLLTVSGNNSATVGAVFVISSGVTASISGLTIANGNTPGGNGGGGIANGGNLTVSNSAFSGNSAGYGGGGIANGIANGNGTLTVSNSTFSGNTAGYGGGIANGGTLTVSNSTFSGNTAGLGGGGIYSQFGTVTVSNSTLAGNSAGSGGGIYNYNGTLTLTNSIVAGNTDTSSGQAGDDCDSCGTQNASNLISTSSSSPSPNLGPLAYNGANQTLQTLLPLPGSPAIEAGNPALLPTSMKTDERGLPRTTTISGNAKLDLGAVETNYTAVQFVQQPTNTLVNATITPAVTLSVMESGAAALNIPVPLTLAGNGTLAGTLTETTLVTKPGTAAVATYGNLSVNTAGTGDTLDVTLPITATGITPALTLTATSSSFDITLQPPTITWTTTPPTSVTYGAAPIMLAATASNGATVLYQVISGPATISGSTLTFTGAGAVEIEAYTNASGNYGAGSLTANINVNKAALTVTANNFTRVYGAANPTFTGSVKGAVNGDTFTESFSTTATASSAVGTYPITPTVTGTHLSDYTVTTVNGTLTVSAVSTPSYTLTANPNTMTIAPGATTGNSTTLALATTNYSGAVTLSCVQSSLPANAYCSFPGNAGARSQVVTLSGSNMNVAMNIETNMATAPPMARMQGMPSPFGSQSPLSPILPALAFWWPGSMAGLAAFGRKRGLSKTRQRMLQLCLLVLMTGALAAGISGCGGSSSSTSAATHITPAGTSTVTVTAAPASGTAQTTTITLTIS